MANLLLDICRIGDCIRDFLLQQIPKPSPQTMESHAGGSIRHTERRRHLAYRPIVFGVADSGRQMLHQRPSSRIGLGLETVANPLDDCRQPLLLEQHLWRYVVYGRE
jgi:hypothetical protein